MNDTGVWQTNNHIEVYLRTHPSAPGAWAGINWCLTFCNRHRLHSSLGGKPPDQTYLSHPTPQSVAAQLSGKALRKRLESIQFIRTTYFPIETKIF